MSNSLDNQAEWAAIFEASDYSPKGVEPAFGLKWSTVSSWLYPTRQTIPPFAERLVIPSKKFREQAIEMINKMAVTPPLSKHPSYGYATPDQIKRLAEIGFCPERDSILKAIELQTRNKGKRQ